MLDFLSTRSDAMPTRFARTLVSVVAISLLLGALVACTPLSLTPMESLAPSSEPPENPQPEKPVAFEFVVPTTCNELIGDELDLQLQALGTTLLSDSTGGGTSPTAPIGQNGGTPFACLYGGEGVDLSTFELSAQPLTAEQHEGVIAELATRGYLVEEEPAYTSFIQVGFDGAQNGPELDATIGHMVYADGWITVYRTFGGAESVDTAFDWAFDIGANVYRQL